MVQVLLEDDGDILTRPVELRQLLLVLRTCASYVAISACVHVSGSDRERVGNANTGPEATCLSCAHT